MYKSGTFLRAKKKLILWPMIMLQNSGPEDKTRIIHYYYLHVDDIVMFLETTPESQESHRSIIVLHPSYGVHIAIDFMNTLEVI